MIFCWWWPVLCSQSFSGVSSLWQSAGKKLRYWTLARIRSEACSSQLLCANSCRYCNLHCLCLNLHSAIKCPHLWFNFTPSHLPALFECEQPLQPLLRQSCARSSAFSPPPYYYGFSGTDFITTTGSSATSTLLTDSCLSTCFCLALCIKYRNKGKGFPR